MSAGSLDEGSICEGQFQEPLKDEGEATMRTSRSATKSFKNGGDDIGVAGAQAAKYDEI